MTNKQIAGALVLLIAVVFGIYAIRNLGGNEGSPNEENGEQSSLTNGTASGTPTSTSPSTSTGSNPPGGPAPMPAGQEVNGTPTLANLTYDIEGAKIKFDNGAYTVGSRKTFLSDYGAWGDLNGNGTPDAAAVLIDQPGGSGTFYYIAAVPDQNGTRRPTNSILLGDRVKIQSVAVANGAITVRFLDRKADEPLAATPTVEKKLIFVVTNGMLVAGAGS